MQVVETIGPASAMSAVLEAFPGAQRALFRRYHVGGCSSCAFRLDETLEELCVRNNLNVNEVLDHLRASHEEDARLWIEPHQLTEALKLNSRIRLLDVRSRDEFEAVHIPGSMLLSQPVMREILAEGADPRPLVIVDHRGKQALDAAAYFIGHGLRDVRCLRGGLDAWSQEVDLSLRRYVLE